MKMEHHWNKEKWVLKKEHPSYGKHKKSVIIWDTGAELISELYLTKGQTTLISYSDLDKVCNYNWYTSHQPKYGYRVATDINYRRVNGKKKKDTLFLHQLLTDTFKSSKVCDHINEEYPFSFELDNRKANLRVVDPHQNQKNRRISVNNSSGCTGVVFSKKDNGYFGRVYYMDTLPYSPLFKRPHLEDAKEVANIYCITLRKLLRSKIYNLEQSTGIDEVDKKIMEYLNRVSPLN